MVLVQRGAQTHPFLKISPKTMDQPYLKKYSHSFVYVAPPTILYTYRRTQGPLQPIHRAGNPQNPVWAPTSYKRTYMTQSQHSLSPRAKVFASEGSRGLPQTEERNLDQKHIFDNNQTQLGLSRSEPGVSLQ